MTRKTAFLPLLAALALAGCTSSGSDPNSSTSAAASAEASQAGAGLNLIFTSQPAPVFPSSAYRQQLIEVEAVEALGSPTTAFMFPPGWNGSSHPFKDCPAEGLPIPDSTQIDNPDEIVQDPYGGGYNINNGGLVKPQADPNGVYTPTTGAGTYITCVNAGGGLRAAYWEGDVFAETGTAVWDTAAAMIKDIGPSQLPVCEIRQSTPHDGLNLGSTDSKGTYHPVSYTHCDKAPCPRSQAGCTVSEVTPLPEATPDGKIVLAAHDASVPITLRCTMKSARMLVHGKLAVVPGAESTCGYPGDLQLTFAPWGVVGAR